MDEENMNAANKKSQELLAYHKKGTDYIKKALSIDENSEKKEEAINYYKLGIDEFMKGLDIRLDDDDQSRLAHIQEKMESNMMMALERVNVLNSTQYDVDAYRRRLEKTRISRGPGVNPNKLTTVTHRQPTSTRTNAATPTLRPKSAAPSQPTSSNKDSVVRKANVSNERIASGTAETGKVAKGVAAANTTSKLPLKDLLKLPNVDKRMVEIILDEMVQDQHVKFSDIVGQEKAKQALTELVILPNVNPELFTGLLQPLKGLLLFGPPGNGKTMLAKAAANEAKCNFFNINSSSLTSKWMGEGEKLVRTLFAVARHLQPSIIFIDEIDSILSERKDNEHEASRRLKTEFFSQFDGMQSNKEDRILVMGATNRPFDLDTAALRRFPKRIYVSLPDVSTRAQLLTKLLECHSHTLTHSQITDLAVRAEGYSGSDLNSLATEAAYGPIREKSLEDLKSCTKEAIRPIRYADFLHSLSQIKVTPPSALHQLNEWNRMYGANN